MLLDQIVADTLVTRYIPMSFDGVAAGLIFLYSFTLHTYSCVYSHGGFGCLFPSTPQIDYAILRQVCEWQRFCLHFSFVRCLRYVVADI